MIQKYINYLVTLKGYSVNTAKGYEKDLRDFARWMQQRRNGARWSTITRADIDEYVGELVTKGLKPATTNRRLSAIAGIYRFFAREGLTTENPCKYESRRKVADSVPNTIATEDIKRAYDHASGAVKIMLGLLATTGIRIQELLDLKYEDINYEDCSIRIQGKGNKQRIVYTTADKLDTLKLIAYKGKWKETIFPMGQREARRMIWQALKPYSNAKQLSPHAIRHTFATKAAAEGINCSTLGLILGHKHMETTQKYIDFGQMQAQRACLQYAILN